jgi:hypothetical protein
LTPRLACQFDFAAPGFCLLDAGPGVDSHALRSWMASRTRLLGRDVPHRPRTDADPATGRSVISPLSQVLR